LWYKMDIMKTENILSVSEPSVSYQAADSNIIQIIQAVREGINYASFSAFVGRLPFSLPEWSGFLHVSERTLQRYQKEKKTFDPAQSERIMQIALLMKMGNQVFGDGQKFNAWLEADNISLGKIKPKELLDSSFGINLLKDELIRIEHGILA